jgi:hypothetical protein
LQLALDTAMGEPTNTELSTPHVNVIAVSRTGMRAEIEIRFRAGERYCCAEPGCFMPTFSRDWWCRLRESLRASAGREPPPMVIKVLGVVEEGALLQVLQLLGLPEASCAYNYEHGPCRERDAR